MVATKDLKSFAFIGVLVRVRLGAQSYKMLKTCWNCKEEKDIQLFDRDKSKKDGRQTRCKTCREQVNKNNRSNRLFNKRKLVFEYYKTHPCVDCGETDPVVLELDHVRGEKVSGIANLVAKNFPEKTILDEIAKCDVRCCNCHRRKTAKELGWYKGLL